MALDTTTHDVGIHSGLVVVGPPILAQLAASMKRKRPKSEITREKRLADIDRFAGSSEEEEEDDEEVEEPMKEAAEDGPVENEQQPIEDAESSSDESDDDKHTMDDSASEDGDEVLTESAPAASGMANAMARILLSTTKKAHPPKQKTTVVLSKTKTPLQLQSTAEAQEAKALKMRRRANREKRLTALYVPGLDLDDNNNNNGIDDQELERYHRRIATRGVVALFNAIAVHQNPTTTQKPQETQNENPNTKLNKDKFLTMIKQRAEAAATDAKKTTSSSSPSPPVQKVKWDALSDEFKLASKKNWDEESSSDEENPNQELVQVEEEE